MPSGPGCVEVTFGMTPDEEGWPPIGSETLWTEPMGAGRYRVDSVPFFVPELAVGDVVVATADEQGRLWAQRRESAGGHCTIRVIPLLDGALLGSTQALLSALSQGLGALGPGVRWESAGPAYSLVAIDLAPEVAPDLTADLAAGDASSGLARVRDWLEAGQRDGAWEYEEACVTPAWLAL